MNHYSYTRIPNFSLSSAKQHKRSGKQHKRSSLKKDFFAEGGEKNKIMSEYFLISVLLHVTFSFLVFIYCSDITNKQVF